MGMDLQDFISQLDPYCPQLPARSLIIEINKIFHGYDAETYDHKHPEIHDQLLALWKAALSELTKLSKESKWRILDFGCGTGFEAEQLVQRLPAGSIDKLVCYDISPEMLDIARAKIHPLFPQATFVSHIDDILNSEVEFNLIATNSLLHHLPNPFEWLSRLAHRLSGSTIWIAGHEPSSRFYANNECASMVAKYNAQLRIKKYVSIRKYIDLLKVSTGISRCPYRETAREAVKRRIFLRRPTVDIICRIVDFNVARSVDDSARNRGFDYQSMKKDLAGDWELAWFHTYSFMGPYYEGYLPKEWKSLAEDLSRRFPNDGANFFSIWRRVGL